jgi:hypothetical protein
MSDEHPSIHTYIADRWCVSTTYRKRPSYYKDIWDYVTEVTTCNKESEGRTTLLFIVRGTTEEHFRTVRALLHNGEDGLKEIEIYD